LYNETSRSGIIGDVQAAFTVFANDSSSVFRLFEFDEDAVENVDICIYPMWAWYSANSTIYYKNDTDFSPRYYYLSEHDLSNTSVENISLYLLDSGDGSSIYIKIVDEDYIPVKGATVKAQRFYVDTNEFLTIEQGTTGETGHTLFHLVEETVDYKFIIELDGSVVKNTQTMRILCLDDPCVIEFQLEGETTKLFDRWTEIDDLEYAWTYNNDTYMVSFTWSDTSGGTQSIRLEGFRDNNVTNVVICNSTTASTSGTLTCNVSAYTDGFVTLKAWRTTEDSTTIISSISLSLKQLWRLFAEDGPFWASILILTFSFIGIWNAPVAVAIVILSTIALYFLNWMNFSILMVAGVALLGLMVLALLRRRDYY